MLTCLTAIVQATAQEAPTVIAVVAVDSYGDLKKQVDWLGGLSGNPALSLTVEQFIALGTGGKGLQGLDTKRPLGLVVTASNDQPGLHGFVPVTDGDALQEALAGVIAPVQLMIDIAIKDDWAIITPKGEQPALDTPGDLFDSVTDLFSLGVKVFPSRMPEKMREEFFQSLEGLQNTPGVIGMDQLPGGDISIDATARESFEQIDAFMAGLSIDLPEERIFVESRIVTAEGSESEAIWNAAEDVKPTIVLPTPKDEVSTIAKGQTAQAIAPESRASIEASLLNQMPFDQDDPTEKLIGTIATDVIAAILDNGSIDAGMTIETDPSAPAPMPSVTIGMKIKDGRALEKKLKEHLENSDIIPDTISMTLDAAENGGFTFHDFSMPPYVVSLAVAEDAVYVIGKGGEADHTAIEGTPDPDFKPFTSLEISLKPLMGLAAMVQPDLLQAIGGAGDVSGQVLFLMRPITRGVASRLSIDADGIKTIATVGMKAVMQMQMQGGPGDSPF